MGGAALFACSRAGACLGRNLKGTVLCRGLSGSRVLSIMLLYLRRTVPALKCLGSARRRRRTIFLPGVCSMGSWMDRSRCMSCVLSAASSFLPHQSIRPLDEDRDGAPNRQQRHRGVCVLKVEIAAGHTLRCASCVVRAVWISALSSRWIDRFISRHSGCMYACLDRCRARLRS